MTSAQKNTWLALAAEALAEHRGLTDISADGQPIDGAYYRKSN